MKDDVKTSAFLWEEKWCSAIQQFSQNGCSVIKQFSFHGLETFAMRVLNKAFDITGSVDVVSSTRMYVREIDEIRERK